MLDSKLAASWSVNTQVLANGQYYSAGVGLGLPSRFVVSADRFGVTRDGQTDLERAIASGDAIKILKVLAGNIGET